MIVIGSESGEIYSLILEENILRELKLPGIHKQPVQFLKWANDNQLLSLDVVSSFLLNKSAVTWLSHLTKFPLITGWHSHHLEPLKR